jgi:lipopolysaccharide transport system permease protein
MWNGDYQFVIRTLISKDFKVRYRNMSLGVFWSLLNPIVMMVVFTFVFSKIFVARLPHYPLVILCGLIPYNFFALAWLTGTTSLVENAALVKRLPVPREIIPITSVLSHCVHLLIQIALLLSLVLVFGLPVSIQWLWLPVIWGLEIVFVCGLALVFSALNVYVRDMRYVVESTNTVLFWLVPVFYSFSMIPAQYREIYQYNPVAALVMALRDVLLDGHAPAATLLLKLTFVSVASLTFGFIVFRSLKNRFFDYL